MSAATLRSTQLRALLTSLAGFAMSLKAGIGSIPAGLSEVGMLLEVAAFSLVSANGEEKDMVDNVEGGYWRASMLCCMLL